MAFVGHFFYDSPPALGQGGRPLNTLKTVFLAALLSAAAYGVYFAVNGPPRIRAGGGTDWEPGPPVVVSTEGEPAPPDVTAGPAGTSSDVATTAPAGGEPPPFSAAQAAEGSAVLGLPPADGGQPFAEESAAPADQRYPSTEAYSPDHTPTGAEQPQDGLAHDPHSATDRYPSTDRYADRYSAAATGANAERYPPNDNTGANDALAPGDTTPPDDVHADFATTMRSAEEMLHAGRLAEAHLELSALYGTPGLTLDEEGRLTDLLDRLAGTVIYSRQHLLEPAYQVQPGDTLERIADSYEVPWQLLANINGIREPGRLRPGDSLKVVKGPFEAYVHLSSFRLVLYVQGRYAGRFPIGIGKDRATPLGDFHIEKKVENPVYYGEQVVPAGDPNNPLGPYALDLGNGIFIHGTNDPRSVGRAESRGCIRLDNRDIKDLFEILTIKSDRSAGSIVSIFQSPDDPPVGEAAPTGPILPPAETAGRPPAASGTQRPSRL